MTRAHLAQAAIGFAICCISAVALCSNGKSAVAPTAPASSTADQAVADIVRAQTRLHALKSLTADIVVIRVANGKSTTARGMVKCLKPNYLWIETREPGHRGRRWRICDGKHCCTNDSKGRWSSVAADPQGASFRDDLLIWSDFYVLYATENARRVVGGADVAIRTRAIGGRAYEVITAVHPSPHSATMAVYIGKWDGLIHRMTVDGGPVHVDETWSNLRQNVPLRPRDFQPRY